MSNLVRKLILQAEQEINDIKRRREDLQRSITEKQALLKQLDEEEKEARKIYKQLRGKENRPLVPAPQGEGTSNISTPNGQPDYIGAIEVLAEQDTFKKSEFMELSGQPDPKKANSALISHINLGRLVRVNIGTANEKDSATYRVVKK